MKFCDRAKVFIESGVGGSGCVSFRREKNIPFGGPDGGHGGRGGHIIIRASKSLMTLIDFRYKHHFRAPSGQKGQGRNKTGAAGQDLYLMLPVGTEIWADNLLLVDLIKDNQEEILLRGGEGGRGNISFVSSTNQAPRQFTPGQPGQQMWIELRLKLLADIGLIGLPNAGKSTLLQALTRASPKIGDYPFTTLVPQLGIMAGMHRDIVIADLPGLIEGAHEGKGLGHRFLSHGERCQGLLHLIDGSSFQGPEALNNVYHMIRQELEAYNPALGLKEEAMVITKSDLISEKTKQALQKAYPQAFMISAVTGEGIKELADFLIKEAMKLSLAQKLL